MRLLDLFCGAGGAAMGYHRAGFDVVGVDIVVQPRYPFEFVQADALEYVAAHGTEFDAIHASPPCQAYSSGRHLSAARGRPTSAPKLIEPVRAALIRTGRPYVIENVVGAPLVNAATVCGSSFARPIRRHRLFESSVLLIAPPCAHEQMPIEHRATFPSQSAVEIWKAGGPAPLSRFVGVYGKARHAGARPEREAAMGIDWMNERELAEAIPPDYTELIGRQLLAAATAAVA